MGNKIEQRYFYHPICNKEETERVLNVKNAVDYLLKLRADTIVDHMRLFRVYRNKAMMNEKDWSLEKSFDSSHYKSFLRNLPEDIRAKCLEITFGNIFSNDPNGTIFQTDFGPIITISDSLQFFLKFSHLALLDFKSHVPSHVRGNALRIAIRVMLNTETLDFLMDPRGIVPTDIGDTMHAPISRELEFIAGHEFAHYFLGHLSDVDVGIKPIYFGISSNDTDYKPMKAYNKSQNNEFQADIHAIIKPHYSPKIRGEVIEAALFWFGCLDLYENVVDTICPRNPWGFQTHPSARERFDNILSNVPNPKGINLTNWRHFQDTIERYKEFLLDDVSKHAELYDMYGSVYLDAPNTEWRGPKLIDRVDYY